ncbi:MAG: hypothetical protein DRN04_13065 [Thermoprotei archaeon]|nr:MAG: hypothetical protein DRN04_13065 [Thermoprotei archaeon]
MTVVDTTLFNEKYDVRDFVMPKNPEIKELALKIAEKAKSRHDYIVNVAKWIAENIEYPYNYKGKPSTERMVFVFKWWNRLYHYENYVEYAWLFPNQVLHVGKGICVDTANLATSLLRAMKFEAYTVLGALLKPRRKHVIGFHAWTEVYDDEYGKWLIIETTTHPNHEVFPKEVGVSGELGVIYDGFAWFNEKVYREDLKKIKRYGAKIYA